MSGDIDSRYFNPDDYQVEARPLESLIEEGREKIERLIEHCETFSPIEKEQYERG